MTRVSADPAILETRVPILLLQPLIENAIHHGAAQRPGPIRIEVTAGRDGDAPVDDLVANGLLSDPDPLVCWQRSVETLVARKGEIAGLAVASDECIEAYLLYTDAGELLALHSVDVGERD